MKTSVVRIAALLLCTAMAPVISSPAWAQASTPNVEASSGASADAGTVREALSGSAGEADGSMPVEDGNVVSSEEFKSPSDSAGSNAKMNDDGSVSTSYDSKPNYYDPYGNPYSNQYEEVWPQGMLMALQRDARLPAGHFALQMSMTKTFVGCVKVSSPKYGTAFKDGVLTITIEKFIVDARDKPKYPHYECNMAAQEPSISIPLSKQLLEDNAVKKIKLRVDKTTETFNVKMTDQYIQLIPDTRRPPTSEYNRFRPEDRADITNPLKFWFYPENTVILSVEGASKDITVESSLKDLARAKGLTPLDDMIPDHAHYRKKADMFYFVDKDGRYKNVNNELFDYLQVDAMKYGLEADEPIKKNVAVFIRKPGQYE